ncbi:MAG: acyltransferase [Novosphingobium sp.]|nr:acyltransferase [Novosphingobium sp.]
MDKRVGHLPILDGWRATSILLVLAGHLVWLGPKSLQLNHVAGAAGMALFFTLSGFLIVSFLHQGTPVREFLVKRAARILPLCWLALAVLVTWQPYDLSTILRNFLFVANLPPASLLEGGHHLWSLCVEMQFYIVVALICLILGRRGLYLVPVLALASTAARIAAGETISIVTWHRIDEILAGGTLALAYAHGLQTRIPLWVVALCLLASSHPETGAFQYLRPYFAALLVGSSLTAAPRVIKTALTARSMAYIAEISYALYVVHGIAAATWLGSGHGWEKYFTTLPLLLAVTFLLAHVSTRYYEKPISRAARLWIKRWRQADQPAERAVAKEGA